MNKAARKTSPKMLQWKREYNQAYGQNCNAIKAFDGEHPRKDEEVEVGEKSSRLGIRKWLLRCAAKEQNPYMQAEILYRVLGETKK